MADERQAYASRTWQTGDVITKQALNNIEDEMGYVSAEINNAVTGTINDQKLNDTLARKLDSVVKYFPNTPNPDTDLEYVRMYAQPSTEGTIIVPTEEEYLRFKQNFVQPFTNKDYTAGSYVEYEDEIYKITTAIAKNNSVADDAAAWEAILAQNPSPVGKINPMEELNNLINVYTSDGQLTNEQNRIWIQQQGESVEVPTYEEFSDLRSALHDGVIPVNLNLVHGALDANGNVVSNTTNWITANYISTDDLLTAYNNTQGRLYVDFYNLVDGAYIFQPPYVTIEPGTSWVINQTKGAYIKLYANTGSTAFVVTQKIGFVQYKYPLASIYNPYNEGVPNIDTADQSITFPEKTTIVSGNEHYLLDSDVTVSYRDHASTAHKIIFNVKTHEMTVTNYNSFSTDTVAVAVITANGISFHGVSITCPYSVDGVFYGIYKNDAFPRIFLGLNGYPNINTSLDTVTIPNGTSIYYRNSVGNNTWYTLSADAVVDLSPAKGNYRGIQIIFNTKTKVFSIRPWNSNPYNNELPIAHVIYDWTTARKILAVNGGCTFMVNNILPNTENYQAKTVAVQKGTYTPDFELGTFGERTGIDAAHGQRARTAFIEIIPNQTHVSIMPVRDDLNFWISIFDENKIYIATINSHWTNAVPLSGISVPITQGAYIRIGTKNVLSTELSEADVIDIERSFRILTMQDAINYEGDITDVISIKDNYYLHEDGHLVYTATACTTALIPAVPGDVIRAEMRTNGGTRWMAFGLYDKNGTYIRRLTFTQAGGSQHSEGDIETISIYAPIPDDGSVGFVRFSFGANHIDYKITQTKRINLGRQNMQSVNHRGFQLYAPENTLEAFKMSKAVGFDMIELDVQFTKDGVPVILHDRSINRTMNNQDGSAISETINIDSIDYNQVLNYICNYGKDQNGKKPSEYWTPSKIKIPTFEETLVLCKRIGLRIRIELKGETVSEARLPMLVNLIEKYGMRQNVEFASFTHSLINQIVNDYPDYDVGYINPNVNTALVNTVNAAQNTLGRKVVCAVSSNCSAEQFETLATTGCVIDIYTAVTDTDILNADSHVSSFTTNYPIASDATYRSVMT